jgi:hypothetical protein
MARYPQYTVVESGNIAMGQSGNSFVDTTGQYTPPFGKIVAITMLTPVEFSELTPESTSSWMGTTAAGPGTGGDTLSNSDTFPEGITIYGRWDSCTLQSNGDMILIYFAT